jgi:hypothetical protein
MQQRLTQSLFESPDLLAYRRLGAVNAFAGPGETSSVYDRDEAAKKVEVEHSATIHISTGEDFIIQFPNFKSRAYLEPQKGSSTYACSQHRFPASQFPYAATAIDWSILPALGVGLFGR